MTRTDWQHVAALTVITVTLIPVEILNSRTWWGYGAFLAQLVLSLGVILHLLVQLKKEYP
jgi:hypothetical protein